VPSFPVDGHIFTICVIIALSADGHLSTNEAIARQYEA